jgi:hypothetical protein
MSSEHLTRAWRATKIGASVIGCIDGSETTIAHVNGIGQERVATARLLAAAPDLYDALKALRDWCDENINGVPLEYRQIMERADSALKNANGEQS